MTLAKIVGPCHIVDFDQHSRTEVLEMAFRVFSKLSENEQGSTLTVDVDVLETFRDTRPSGRSARPKNGQARQYI